MNWLVAWAVTFGASTFIVGAAMTLRPGMSHMVPVDGDDSLPLSGNCQVASGTTC